MASALRLEPMDNRWSPCSLDSIHANATHHECRCGPRVNHSGGFRNGGRVAVIAFQLSPHAQPSECKRVNVEPRWCADSFSLPGLFSPWACLAKSLIGANRSNSQMAPSLPPTLASMAAGFTS